MKLNKVYHESNMETMSRMENDFVDIVVTSPPYNLGKRAYESGLQYDSYDDNLSLDNYFKQTKTWIDELLRITKYHVFWNIQEVSGNRGIISFIMNEYKDQIKEVFIWAKRNPASHIIDTMCANGYEYIFCFSKDDPKSKKFNYCNFSNRNGDYMKNILIKPSNAGNQETKGHSFAFGDWLPNFFIYNFSKPNDIVYDPFMGTGTTAKSAHTYKRRWIGSEISEEYINLTNKRMKPYLDQTTLF